MRLLILALVLLIAPAASAQIAALDYGGDCADAQGGCEVGDDISAANAEAIKDKLNVGLAAINALDATTNGVADTAAAMSGSGQIDDGDLAGNAVDGGLGGEIEDASITAADLAANSVDASEIAVNSVALSTDTTGNYVATIADSGASEVTVANSGSEGAAVTLALAAAIMRDAEASVLTVTTTNITDPGTACTAGDIYLDTNAIEVCFCIDSGTDNWACVTLTD